MAKTTEYHVDVDSYIGYPISKAYVRSKLAPLKGKPVNVRVNSYGGSLNDALDIRQQFIDHGNVTVYIFGMTASAATILSMGAAKVCMSRYAMFLAHKVSNWVDEWGQMNADQVQQVIDNLTRNKQDLDKLDLVCASIYARKCNRPVNELLNTLKEGRWLNAEEALRMGFIDEIIEEGEKPEVTAEVREHFAALGLELPEMGREPDEREQRFFESMFSRFSSFMASKGKTTTNQHIQNDMKKEMKECASVCLALGIKDGALEIQNGTASLTTQQVDALEQRIKTLQDNVSALEEDKKELEEQVLNLQKGDGDETKDIEDKVEDDIRESTTEWFNKFEDYI